MTEYPCSNHFFFTHFPSHFVWASRAVVGRLEVWRRLNGQRQSTTTHDEAIIFLGSVGWWLDRRGVGFRRNRHQNVIRTSIFQGVLWGSKGWCMGTPYHPFSTFWKIQGRFCFIVSPCSLVLFDLFLQKFYCLQFSSWWSWQRLILYIAFKNRRHSRRWALSWLIYVVCKNPSVLAPKESDSNKICRIVIVYVLQKCDYYIVETKVI